MDRLGLEHVEGAGLQAKEEGMGAVFLTQGITQRPWFCGSVFQADKPLVCVQHPAQRGQTLAAAQWIAVGAGCTGAKVPSLCFDLLFCFCE